MSCLFQGMARRQGECIADFVPVLSHLLDVEAFSCRSTHRKYKFLPCCHLSIDKVAIVERYWLIAFLENDRLLLQSVSDAR